MVMIGSLVGWMNGRRRLVQANSLAFFLAPVVVAALLLLLGAQSAWAQESGDSAAGANAAGEVTSAGMTATIVVQTDGGLLVHPITFTEAISGLAALQASGLDVTVAETTFGPAVCAIAGVGCPADDCFCGGDNFWNYSAWDGEAWVGYATGASTSIISETSAIEGWRWGVYTGTATSPLSIVESVPAALEWLHTQQSPYNGGYSGMGGAAETLFAIGANAIAARDWQTAKGVSLESYARAQQTKYARNDVAGAGKVAVALAAADACWNGRSRLPMAWYDEDLGAYSADSGPNAWGILGTLALSESVPVTALATLRDAMQPNGGWEWMAGFGPDSNTTALVVQTLIAAGDEITSTEVMSGLAYLAQAQQDDGGFAYDLTSGGGSDANSTAYVVQALVAAGQDPTGEPWSVEGVTPIDYLLSLQLEDGSFEWQAGTGSNLFATQQVVPALLQRPYPIAVRPVATCVWK
jgi:hypothetical protein